MNFLIDKTDPARLCLLAAMIALMGGAVSILQGSEPLTIRSVTSTLLGSALIGMGSVLLWLGAGPMFIPEKQAENTYIPLLIALPCGYCHSFVLEFIRNLVKRLLSSSTIDKIANRYGDPSKSGTTPTVYIKPPSDEILKPNGGGK